MDIFQSFLNLMGRVGNAGSSGAQDMLYRGSPRMNNPRAPQGNNLLDLVNALTGSQERQQSDMLDLFRKPPSKIARRNLSGGMEGDRQGLDLFYDQNPHLRRNPTDPTNALDFERRVYGSGGRWGSGVGQGFQRSGEFNPALEKSAQTPKTMWQGTTLMTPYGTASVNTEPKAKSFTDPFGSSMGGVNFTGLQGTFDGRDVFQALADFGRRGNKYAQPSEGYGKKKPVKPRSI